VIAAPSRKAACAASCDGSPIKQRRAEARRVCLCPTDARQCACSCVREPTSDGSPIEPEGLRGRGRGCAEKAEASHGTLQRAIASCNGNPLVDEYTGARHADVRLGDLWIRHGLKKGTRGLWPRWFYSKLNRNKPDKTDRKIYLHGKYISPSRIKFAS
jgi:hypothetical protein